MKEINQVNPDPINSFIGEFIQPEWMKNKLHGKYKPVKMKTFHLKTIDKVITFNRGLQPSKSKMAKRITVEVFATSLKRAIKITNKITHLRS